MRKSDDDFNKSPRTPSGSKPRSPSAGKRDGRPRVGSGFKPRTDRATSRSPEQSTSGFRDSRSSESGSNRAGGSDEARRSPEWGTGGYRITKKGTGKSYGGHKGANSETDPRSESFRGPGSDPQPRTEGFRGPRTDSKSRAGGFRGPRTDSAPRSGGFRGPRTDAAPRSEGFRGPKRDAAPRSEGFRGPKRDAAPRTEGFRGPRSDAAPRSEGFRGPRSDAAPRSEGFRGPRSDAAPRSEGFRGPRRDAAPRSEGYKGPRRDAAPRSEGYRGPRSDAAPRSEGYKGPRSDAAPRSEGYKGPRSDAAPRSEGFRDNKRSFENKGPRAPIDRKFDNQRPREDAYTNKEAIKDNVGNEMEEREDRVEGRNPVFEAIRSGRPLNKLFVEKDSEDPMLSRIVAMAREKDVPVQYFERFKLDSMSQTRIHQGVILEVAAQAYVEVSDILAKAAEKNEKPFVLVLDEITDTNNLGSIIRSAECSGVHGIVLPKRRSATLNATVAKVAAGALEYVPVARVSNLVQTLRELKGEGLWIIGADMEGEKDYYDTDLKGPCALVIGSEGEGLARLVKEECDLMVKIPLKGKISSLNAGVAAALIMFEISKQRG